MWIQDSGVHHFPPPKTRFDVKIKRPRILANSESPTEEAQQFLLRTSKFCIWCWRFIFNKNWFLLKDR
jgi:hypothetical protein